jgi:Tol biopolymer transport system component
MTAEQRFERALPTILDDLYLGPMPDYRDDLLRQTARTTQRPAWSFPGRWLPMADLATERVTAPRFPWRLLVAAVLIVVLAFAAVAFVGSQVRRVPPPFGPAGNGDVLFTNGGDLYAVDPVTQATRLLVGGPDSDGWLGYSPDGTHIAFGRDADHETHMMLADADGTNVVDLTPDWFLVDPQQWVFSPDGNTILADDLVAYNQARKLNLIRSDGRGHTTLEVGMSADFATYRPPDGRQILFRGYTPSGRMGLFLVNPDGTGLVDLGLRGDRLFGETWDLSGAMFSPDGQRIAYNVVEIAPDDPSRTPHFRIHIMNADGSGDITLPSDGVDVHQGWPMWSPDGKWISAQRWKWDTYGALAILPTDGSSSGFDVQPKEANPVESNWHVSWAPDGTKVLAFSDGDKKLFEVDPIDGSSKLLPWSAEETPDWQRVLAP